MNGISKFVIATALSSSLIIKDTDALANEYASNGREPLPVRLVPETLADGLLPGFDRPNRSEVSSIRSTEYTYAPRLVPQPNRFRLEPVGEPPRGGLGVERERVVNNVLQLRF